jgi:hypothetical protein
MERYCPVLDDFNVKNKKNPGFSLLKKEFL